MRRDMLTMACELVRDTLEETGSWDEALRYALLVFPNVDVEQLRKRCRQ